ncbi:hypothetical protein DSO57_1013756 [Entomophthora muscae]|uniref:Uncharacterized protein n=1 Tax=Entomophthora muscae TaxID=34485 RepID=A0ACC2RKF4_9FUNG|nr:hypothetical protein DSO57_1013756 [Entomophthora muscae]
MGARVSSPFSPWGENRLSHAYLLRQPQSLFPSPFFLPSLLAPFKDAFDATLSCVLPPHSCHNLTFETMVDLVKIDAPMYPLSELEDKVLGVWLDNMLAKG